MESYIIPEADSFTLVKDSQTEPRVNLSHPKEPDVPDQPFKIDLSYKRGIVSRIRGYMDPSELMGFAARGLFMIHILQENLNSNIVMAC